MVGILLGFATAIMDAVLTPAYIGSVRSPIAPLLALIGNAGLVWFTYTVTRRAGLSLIPGAAWFITFFIAATKTSEGDLIVTGTWVSFLTLILGSLGWAGAGYRIILRRAVQPRGERSLITTNRMSAEAAKPGKSAGAKSGPGERPGTGKSGAKRRPAN